MVLLSHTDLDGNNFQNSDVVDNGSYSIEGSKKNCRISLPAIRNSVLKIKRK